MPYAVNASAAMYNGGDFVNTCTKVSPMNKITPVTNWQNPGIHTAPDAAGTIHAVITLRPSSQFLRPVDQVSGAQAEKSEGQRRER